MSTPLLPEVVVLTLPQVVELLEVAAQKGADNALRAIDRAPARLLSRREVNVILGYSPTNCGSVHELVATGRLRAITIGNEFRFRPSDVAAFMEAQATDAPGASPSALRRAA